MRQPACELMRSQFAARARLLVVEQSVKVCEVHREAEGRLFSEALPRSALQIRMNKPAAIYARVSSDRQKENHTIGSQTSALVEYAQTHGYAVPSEWVFQDEGYSGASLVRPGLEALRDLAAQG